MLSYVDGIIRHGKSMYTRRTLRALLRCFLLFMYLIPYAIHVCYFFIWALALLMNGGVGTFLRDGARR
jgi:hypothetical protein